MANMASKVRHSFDADNKITLRPAATAAIVTATTVNGSAVSLDALTSYWDNDIVPHQSLEVLVNVNVSAKPGAETSVLSLQLADDQAFTTNVKTVATLPDVAGLTGVFVLPLDVITAKKYAPTAKFMRIVAVTTGAGTNFDFYAWMI